MVVSFNYRQVLRSITFPIYAVRNEDFYLRDGLILLNEKVIDDRNQPGDTLGKRRLQTPHPLLKLGKCCEEFINLLKSKDRIHIDTKGNIFSYEKTKWTKTKSIRIKRKEVVETHTRLWLQGVNFPFLERSPPHGKDWANVLYFNKRPWIIYSFSEEREKDFRRKI